MITILLAMIFCQMASASEKEDLAGRKSRRESSRAQHIEPSRKIYVLDLDEFKIEIEQRMVLPKIEEPNPVNNGPIIVRDARIDELSEDHIRKPENLKKKMIELADEFVEVNERYRSLMFSERTADTTTELKIRAARIFAEVVLLSKYNPVPAGTKQNIEDTRMLVGRVSALGIPLLTGIGSIAGFYESYWPIVSIFPAVGALVASVTMLDGYLLSRASRKASEASMEHFLRRLKWHGFEVPTAPQLLNKIDFNSIESTRKNLSKLCEAMLLQEKKPLF